MGRLKDLIINIGASTKNLDKELGKTRNKINGMSRNLQKVGRNMSAAVTAPLVGIGVAASKTFVDFEFQMAKVKAVSGATGGQFAMLEKQAKDLGASTMHTASDVAGLQLELSRLGFTAKETQNATASILDLATATDSNLASAADVVGSTLRAFGQDASQAGHLSDVMAASFSGSALSMDSFSNAMQYVAPIAKTAGVSLEQTSAMMAVLANNGIRGSKAGRALRRILTEMSMTGKPVMEALKDVTSKGLDLKDAFDEVGRSAQSQLIILGDNMDQIDDLTESFTNSDGAARKMAATMEDTTHGAIKRMQSALEGASLEIGQNLAPHIVAAADKVAELAQSFARLTPETQASIIKTAGIVAALGPMLVILPQIVTSVGLLGTALKLFATNPVMIALTFAVSGFANLAGKIKRAREETEQFNNLESETARLLKESSDRMKDYHEEVDATASTQEKLADLTLPNLQQALGRVNGSVAEFARQTSLAIGTEDLDRIKELEESYKGVELFGLTPLEAALADYRAELKKTAEAENAAGDAAVNSRGETLEEFKKRSKEESKHRKLMQQHENEFLQSLIAEEKQLKANAKAKHDAYEPEEITLEPEEVEAMDPALEKLGKKLAKARDMAKQFGSALQQAVEQGAESIATNMGTMIGGIMAGTNSVRDLGNSLLTGLADLAIDIGKIAIATGIAIQGIKDALTSLHPAVAIAAGIALIALGSAVKGSLAKKAEGMGDVPKLAKGGLAYGPQIAMVGDNPGARTDPEVIAPLSKLQGMMGGAHVTGTIKGRDIVLSQERGGYSRRRKFGN